MPQCTRPLARSHLLTTSTTARSDGVRSPRHQARNPRRCFDFDDYDESVRVMMCDVLWRFVCDVRCSMLCTMYHLLGSGRSSAASRLRVVRTRNAIPVLPKNPT